MFKYIKDKLLFFWHLRIISEVQHVYFIFSYLLYRKSYRVLKVYTPSSHDTNQKGIVLISNANKRFTLLVECQCITVFLIIFHGNMLSKLLSVHIFFSKI